MFFNLLGLLYIKLSNCYFMYNNVIWNYIAKEERKEIVVLIRLLGLFDLGWFSFNHNNNIDEKLCSKVCQILQAVCSYYC